MRRIAIALLLGLVAHTSADVKVATSTRQVEPGTYSARSFVTRFDGEGHWATSAVAGGPVLLKGRYTIDGDLITFAVDPPQSSGRVRYRLTFERAGFHLHLLREDNSWQATQAPDLTFVRVGAQVAK